MRPTPLRLADANAFVARLHRHCDPVVGHRFSVGAVKNDQLVGVAICTRPNARGLDPDTVLEVRRLCTDGTKNACSFLYGVSARVAKELGYHRIVTYILDSEPGTSLRAAGWALEDNIPGREWNYSGQHRTRKNSTLFGEEDKYSNEPKSRWGKVFYLPAMTE